MNLDALNLAAVLYAIRACEGTLGPNGYRALFGYRESRGGPLFDSFADHPNVRRPFRQTDGTTNYTTAAGAYQFIFPTWKRLQRKHGLADFSQASQDRAAIALIDERGALGDARAGRLNAVVAKCSAIWASLPASTYKQPLRTLEFAANAFIQGGGVIAA